MPSGHEQHGDVDTGDAVREHRAAERRLGDCGLDAGIQEAGAEAFFDAFDLQSLAESVHAALAGIARLDELVDRVVCAGVGQRCVPAEAVSRHGDVV